ncbi:MAG: type II toxin-antitoxin system HipA family toxin, partial [Actinobacteria bacterium]|nr:type II toxin-antitoxin system HipA family toxin [Actinomycetota bacterium]
MNRDVEVHVDLLDSRTVLAGELSYETNVGGALVSTSFRYATDWLADPGAYALCPELPLVEGRRRFTG